MILYSICSPITPVISSLFPARIYYSMPLRYGYSIAKLGLLLTTGTLTRTYNYRYGNYGRSKSSKLVPIESPYAIFY